MFNVIGNTIVSHSKGLQKRYERRVMISANTEMISEKKGGELKRANKWAFNLAIKKRLNAMDFKKRK